MKRASCLVGLALMGCPAAPTDPPPPPRKLDLVPAPPNAQGARAAGTDAAPKPELGIPLGAADDGSTAPTEPGPDAGTPDAAPPGDSGMAL